MKRLLATILALTMAVSFAACGDQPEREDAPSATPIVSTTATAPRSMGDCVGEDRSSIENEFFSAGFENITTEQVEDLESAEADKVGSVISVSINGQSEFEQGQEFDKNDEVVIRYHAFKKYAVTIHVDFVPNLIFSTYDVTFDVNDMPQGTLEHGEDKDFELTLEPGEYTLVFEEDGDSEVNGSATVNITGETDVSLKIACFSDKIDVETLSFRDLEAEREAAALALEAEKEQAALETALEETFPKEMAKRAVVVAMTNCQATDVFAADGNSYDPSKFHSYSDIGDFFMTIDADGTWSALDESTWHVDGMTLRIFGYDTYLKATCDIKLEGDTYVVSNVDKMIAAKDSLDSGDPSEVNSEHLEPTESTPFLTVPHALISEERDTTAAEEKVTAAEKEAAAKEARQTWIEDQFNWWDGRHTALSDLIKENLNDSDSFEHVDASYIDVADEASQATVNQNLAEAGFSERVEVGDLFVIEEFTAKNVFNATIKSMAFGIVRGSDNSVILLGIL